MEFKKIFQNNKVLITGHNGFKGSWLTLWLSQLNANIVGISLKKTTTPSHYKLLSPLKNVKNFYFDIRKRSK